MCGSWKQLAVMKNVNEGSEKCLWNRGLKIEKVEFSPNRLFGVDSEGVLLNG
jgi:hypothetical protein